MLHTPDKQCDDDFQIRPKNANVVKVNIQNLKKTSKLNTSFAFGPMWLVFVNIYFNCLRFKCEEEWNDMKRFHLYASTVEINKKHSRAINMISKFIAIDYIIEFCVLTRPLITLTLINQFMPFRCVFLSPILKKNDRNTQSHACPCADKPSS